MIEVVCGIIRDDGGRYLACRRPADKHLGGLWEFPGGKIEAGETAEDALVRELREELGIEVAVERPLAEVSWDYETVSIRLRPFLCRIISGEPRAIEHHELAWTAEQALELLAWSPADEPILAELQNFPSPAETSG